LITRDGRRIYWVNPIFYGLPLCEAQVVQEKLDRVRIRYVPAQGFAPEDERLICSRLQERMGKVEILFERMTNIPRRSNGKFQPVICNLSEEERRDIGQAV
jgi:phenylacetate-CoA ligase